MDLGIEVVGISRDLAPSQGRFKEVTGAQNHFLSDPALVVTERYGAVRDDLNVRVAMRYYFLIDEEGTLVWKNVEGGLIPVESLLTEIAGVVGAD